ncbi:centromere/kinetochore protein zw10 homolog isoform X2 [Cryptomeria japonica]|uniref:centromere/kinetochore protein zw10 homolog isoform X2 n=1 Tax=Cryptomeria japonica TaxID=3369 RepID=UPI0027DA2FF5|nr:centromere/kinetochore protein zw10 homolog isoform X2 [Cryptomeria japonica]
MEWRLVKELLTENAGSEEVDESRAVSAPYLHHLKDRLHMRSLQIKDRVHNYIKSHYHDFFNIISVAFHASNEVQTISQKLHQIFDKLSDGYKDLEIPIDSQLCRLAAERASVKKDLCEKEEARRLVLTISDYVKRLENARINVEQGHLIQAARALQELRIALRVSQTWTQDELRVSSDLLQPQAFTLLKIEWASCFSKLQELLEDLFNIAIRVDNDHTKLCVDLHLECEKLPASFGGIDLASVLMAMEIVGILDAGFARLADSLIKYIIIPIIHNSSINIISDESVKNKPVLSQDLPSGIQTEGVSPEALYSKLLHVLKFVYQYICFEKGIWMKLIGRLIWPKLSEAIITNCLAKAVPDEVSEVTEFQMVVKLTRDFEHELKDMALISSSDDKDDRLSNFALNIEIHFASKKKNYILATVRKLIVQSNFKAVELLFWPSTLAVSLAAKQLMEIVHEALKDACSSPRQIALEFYHAVRDALLLYRAIVPVKLAKELNTLSQVAIIVHNDCLYLAQEILGLAFEYRESLPNELKENFVFVDLAPLFHQLAEQMLNHQVAVVLSGLKEALDQANGFQNTHKKQQSEMASLALDQAVVSLENARLLWQPLLQKTIYKKAMQCILQHFFACVGSEILMLDDMSVEETLQLRKLVQTALGNMSSLLKSVIDDEMRLRVSGERFEKDDNDSQILWDQFEKLIPSLHKLRRITDLLDMSLKSITLSWESGELIVSGFNSLEVQKLVRAIFSDTTLRRECLKRIENTEFILSENNSKQAAVSRGSRQEGAKQQNDIKFIIYYY